MGKVLNSIGMGEGKRVFLAIPTYGGICAEFVISLVGSRERLAAAGIVCDVQILSGNCHVDDSRNLLVRNFLQSECDELIFLDADVQFDPEYLQELASYDRPVVAGVYPLKGDEEEFPVKFCGGELWADTDGLIKVDKVPTGFLKIQRPVLEAIDKTVPHHKLGSDLDTDRMVPIIFERTLRDHTRLGGDYEFCAKWKALGGEIFVNPSWRFGHVGEKEWCGSLAHHLRKKHNLQDNFIRTVLGKIQRHEETMADLVELWYAWDNPWAMVADELHVLIAMCRDKKPHVLECGSGLTTLVMLAAGASVDCVDHDEEWADKVRKFGVDVTVAPIVGGWYDVQVHGPYSMVLVDGPPRWLGSRAGVMKHKDKFTDDCIFVVDDANTHTETITEIEAGGVTLSKFGRLAIGRINDSTTGN